MEAAHGRTAEPHCCDGEAEPLSQVQTAALNTCLLRSKVLGSGDPGAAQGQGRYSDPSGDPKTGTVVEFKGKDGASVRYDQPHPNSPGPAHDQPHIAWQSGGKVAEGGRQRGNIPYGGQQHPSSTNRQTGNVKPH